jgi:hypothetical protein
VRDPVSGGQIDPLVPFHLRELAPISLQLECVHGDCSSPIGLAAVGFPSNRVCKTNGIVVE